VTDPRDRPLHEHDLDPDPFALFARWYRELHAAGVPEPEAVALATATPDGAPSLRMVLGKGLDENAEPRAAGRAGCFGPHGFVFFTNYGSRKGTELEANPRGALLFHWPELGRQVRIEGPVERVPREQSEAYARTRTRGSRLSALASPQSRPVPSRAWLEERVAELAREHEGDDLPLPDDWGGYRLTPEAWEFWQHRPDRLHDRFRYLPAEGGGWRIERLGP
jgi:pyridoxamine 5'-phosphate oxidase